MLNYDVVSVSTKDNTITYTKTNTISAGKVISEQYTKTSKEINDTIATIDGVIASLEERRAGQVKLIDSLKGGV